MVEGKGKPEEDSRRGAGPHEEFLELCAVATSGNLSEEEKKKLNEHLATCAECQKAAKEFQDVADKAIPALAEELAPEVNRGDRKEDSSFNQEAAEASFLRRLSEGKKRSRQESGEADGWLAPLVVRRSRNFRRNLERLDFWLPLAAAGLLCLALGILTYRMGKHRGVDVARREQDSAIPRDGISQETLAAVARERDAANARLSAEDTAISALKHEMARQSSENAKLKTHESDQEVALENSAREKGQLNADHDHLAQELAAGQVSLQTTEDKLRKLETERSESVIHTASLEAQVAELSRVVTDQQKDIGKEKELLAKDKDIRELMGARNQTMSPLLPPGTFVQIDAKQARVQKGPWKHSGSRFQFARPIYFLDIRTGYACGWIEIKNGVLELIPHPDSGVPTRTFRYPGEVDVVGRVTGVAMRIAGEEFAPVDARGRRSPSKK